LAHDKCVLEDMFFFKKFTLCEQLYKMDFKQPLCTKQEKVPSYHR